MARKHNPVFPGRQKRRESAQAGSWAAVGIDTSMTAISMVGIGYDSVLGKMTKVRLTDCRWPGDMDYIQRLASAAKTHEMMFDVLPINCPLDRVWIAQEEPVPMGMIGARRGNFQSGWIKQQCEVSGAVLGSLAKYGYPNIFQINNSQWRSAVKKEGQVIRKGPEGKWDVKAWAIQAYGLPDLADLVAGKNGGKIPRPESGYGAKAKAVQPDDIYDAAACLAWMTNHIEEGGLI
jgi:hypothetical protein